ncbi:olfactory receptor 52K1-like [Lepisosteus oculatus]|uniref:olfactory receptor 52K1-like n=1 Tax=Lepisosteus oculatus TaxID=7918 RepID=UPI003720B806
MVDIRSTGVNLQGHAAGNTSYVDFILIGFPGIYQHRRLLSIPFFVMFLFAIAGNSTIIFVIKTGSALHSPMYVLINTLAIVNLILPVFFVPKMLLNFLFDWNEISLLGCLIQMFFIHFVNSFESTILLVMALDRYAAICKPLRYNDYINTSTFLKLSAAAIIRSGIFVSIVVILAGSLSYCLSNVIEHCYCEHMALVGLACGSTTKNSIMGLIGIVCIAGLDFLFICFSYLKIFSEVFKTGSGKSCQKAMHTCITHLIVLVASYTLALCSFIAYRFGKSIPPDVHNLISVMYIIFPSCFNPVIYGVRTKEIRDQILRTVRWTKSDVISSKVASITQ